MKPWIQRFTMISILCTGLFAQMDWFGYLESEWDQINVNRQPYNFGYLKLRLDLESRPTESVLVAANVNLQQYMGKTRWNLLDFLPATSWQSFYPPGSEYLYTYRDTLYLDNAYLRVNFTHLDLTVGKQPISLGTGYVWNPVDIFNLKDPVDPTYEQTGIQALRADIPLTSRGGLTAILTPGEDWDQATKYLQLKSGLGSFDFTLNWAQYMGLFRYWEIMTYTGTAPTMTQFQSLGGTVVGQIFGIGIWAETWRKQHAEWGNKTYWETVVGFDYTFENGWMILNEFFYNEQGSKPDRTGLYDYFAYFEGQTHSLMQRYDFFYSSYPVGDFVNLGLLSIFNLDDHSAMISPQLDWNLFENGNLSFWYLYPVGDNDTEFGFQDAGWRIRLRTYF
ncbi:MAG: hypothetical protein GXO90_04705 [FCB group bacterium]|nr:hypothetical protein [FCB group bacterium]